jgi:hypothetical protein
MRLRAAAGVLLALMGVTRIPAADEPVRLVAQWSSPESAGKKFYKILAMGIADDRELRHRFEDKMVSHLRGQDILAVTSYSMVPDLMAPGSREEILKKIEAQHIDAAITFRLVPLGKQEESAWDAEWMRQTQEAGTLRELIASSLPLKLEKSETYGVEVTLWAEATPARQWTARTAPHGIKALRQGSTMLIQDVIQTLRYYHKI